jgi:hypothetical protein
MNIAWQFGFGWPAVLLAAIFGAGSYYISEGWLHWLLYLLFAATGAYMFVKFRLYSREPWRRVHARGMDTFAELTRAEAAAADKEGRPLDMARVCGQLAANLEVPLTGWGPTGGDVLTDETRKAYYRELAETFPAMFTKAVADDKKDAALKSVLKDIDASKLGPDIVIAVAIDKRYGQPEAARFLLALASGATVRRWLVS